MGGAASQVLALVAAAYPHTQHRVRRWKSSALLYPTYIHMIKVQLPPHTQNTGSGGGKALHSCIQHIHMIKVQLPTHSTPLESVAKTNAKEILLTE